MEDQIDVCELHRRMKGVKDRCEISNIHCVKMSDDELVALQQVVEHLRNME